MAFNDFPTTKFVFPFLTLISYYSQAILARPYPTDLPIQLPNDLIVSPFNFVKALQGHHMGEHVNGIHDLKTYLKNFGYLKYNTDNVHSDDDDFDDILENAVKSYQLNYHLKPTGDLDEETIANMVKPRCGVPDHVKDAKTKKHASKNGTKLHTTSHYSFFEGDYKWAENKYNLTFAFHKNNTKPEHKEPIRRALQTWANVSHFKFKEIQDFENADIKMGFYEGDHGDGGAFDGPNGVLAHAFAPEDGRLHFDAAETWGVDGEENGYDLETTALHEFGHILGLEHSDVESAIMYASISAGATKGLHDDDIEGIKALYNS